MKHKDLIRLPLGKYFLTDGIWNYELTKFKKDWGDNGSGYRIKEEGAITTSLTLYEEQEDVFDDSDRFQRTVLSFHFMIAGLSGTGKIHYMLSRLKFVRKSSYKEWLNSIEAKQPVEAL